MFTPTSVQTSSTVPGQVDPAVVGAHPDQARSHRRLGQSDDGGMGFCAGYVAGQAPTFGIRQLRVVGGEIGADDLPAVPPVEAPEEVVSPEQERFAVVGGKGQGRGPVEAEELRRATGHLPAGPGKSSSKLMMVEGVGVMLSPCWRKTASRRRILPPWDSV